MTSRISHDIQPASATHVDAADAYDRRKTYVTSFTLSMDQSMCLTLSKMSWASYNKQSIRTLRQLKSVALNVDILLSPVLCRHY